MRLIFNFTLQFLHVLVHLSGLRMTYVFLINLHTISTSMTTSLTQLWINIVKVSFDTAWAGAIIAIAILTGNIVSIISLTSVGSLAVHCLYNHVFAADKGRSEECARNASSMEKTSRLVAVEPQLRQIANVLISSLHRGKI